MKCVIASLFFLLGSGCLSTVNERWCDAARPCTPGFVCTTDGHCVLPGALNDGGTGGGVSGGGSGGGTGGGGAGGGAGGAGGGGGVSACAAMSCPGGCCLGASCVPVMFQTNEACGFFGEACGRCGIDEGCVGGKCLPVINVDAGIKSAVGGPCEADFDCGNDGLSFCIPSVSGGQPTGFVDGYCSRTCDQDPCPQNASCVEAETGGGTVNICLAQCGVCRTGYQCEQQGNLGVCLPF